MITHCLKIIILNTTTVTIKFLTSFDILPEFRIMKRFPNDHTTKVYFGCFIFSSHIKTAITRYATSPSLYIQDVWIRCRRISWSNDDDNDDEDEDKR